jgi:trimethylamine--corrinoid protein Co-methyltransferase
MTLDVDLMTQATPLIDRLDGGGMAAIHEASLYILEEQGIQVKLEAALDYLEAAGATIGPADLVTVERSLVEDKVDETPASFTLHAPSPENDLNSGTATRFGHRAMAPRTSGTSRTAGRARQSPTTSCS